MTYLAYDPSALAALRRHTEECIHQLFRVRSDDGEAAAAMRAVRAARDLLTDELMPVIRRVEHADALARNGDDRLDLPALSNSLARWAAVSRGWSVAPDPTPDDRRVVTLEEAEALAWRLSQLAPDAVTSDPATRDWLVEELDALSRNPDAAIRFTAAFDGWERWAAVLGRHRANERSAFDETDLTVADLDGLIGAFARVAHHAAVRGGAGSDPFAALPWLTAVPPYAAALFLNGLRLPDPMLAAAATRLATAEDPMGLDLQFGPDTMDVLVSVLRDHPAALLGFFDATSGDPGVWFHCADAEAVRDALVAATDPTVADHRTAGRVVLASLQWLTANPELATGEVLAGLVAPWTVQFSSANDDWEMGGPERGALIAAALRVDDALDLFVLQTGAIVAGARETFERRHTADATEVESYVEMMGGLIVSERVRRSEARRAAWATLATAVAVAGCFLPGVWPGVAVTAATEVVPAIFAPEEHPEWKEIRARDLAITMLAADAAAREYEYWLRRGWASHATIPPPPGVDFDTTDAYAANFIQRFDDWLEALPDHDTWDGFYTSRMALRVLSILNGALVGRIVNEYVYSGWKPPATGS